MTIKYNKFNIFLSIIVFLNLNAFYLIDSDKIPISDITILVGCIFAMLVYIKYYRHKFKNRYGKLFVFPIVLIITSSIMSMYSYNQPFMLGIRPQRIWLFVILIYFPINKLIKLHKINEHVVLRMIDRVNLIYFIVVLAQYILGEEVQLLYTMVNERYDSIRLYVSMTFIMISYCVHLNKILMGNSKTKWDYVYVFMAVFMALFIVKTRMRIVAFLVASMLLVLGQRRTARKLIIAGLVLILVSFLFATNIGEDIMMMLLDPAQSMQDTSSIRNIGRVFYVKETFQSPITAIFGCGFPNITWEQTVLDIHYEEGIYMNDNGVFGILFMYGLSFVVWMFVLYVKLIKDAYQCKRKEYACWLMMGVLGMLTLYPDCYGNFISFAIVAVLIENEVEQKQKLDFVEGTYNEHIGNTCTLE